MSFRYSLRYHPPAPAEVSLGRNVLNLLNLQLDGPNEIVSMLS
jgi:hypothetical protein